MKLNRSLIILSSLFVFAACQKDSVDPLPPSPVTEPLTIAAAKAGDTVYIKGEHFSEAIEKNTVQFNGVAGTIVVATIAELKVVVPANATTGPVTVTVNGQTVTVGNLIINPFRLYAVKSNYQGNTIRQLISIDPATGNETVITALDGNDDVPDDMVYLPATNELIGVKNGTGLIRINLASSQPTSVTVITETNVDIQELVVDKYSNLYAVKRNWSNDKFALIKIDPKTGSFTVVKEFTYAPKWESLVYLTATHEVVGIANNARGLFKLNLVNKDTATVPLHGALDIDYRELGLDNQSRMYAYKGDYSDPDNAIGQIVTLNIATGQETLVATTTEFGRLEDQLIFVPQRNELMSIAKQTSLYRLNVNTKIGSALPLTTQQNITYNELISN